MFFKIGVLKNFANFTTNHLRWSVFLIKLQSNFILKSLQHRCFNVKFEKFLRALFSRALSKEIFFCQKYWIKRELPYPFNWIRFLEINKLCNVIVKNLTFSTNPKLISISWKVWTFSNFSTNWKWKWMNRIRHGRKNVVGK